VEGEMMRFLADYTVGVVIVMAHLVMISLRGEELRLQD
jgi:hypothetical protein